jgi:hypothetical protein
MFYRSQLDFSDNSISISAVSLTSRQTLTKCKQSEKIAKNSKCTGRERIVKKGLAAFVFVPSDFGDKFPTTEY